MSLLFTSGKIGAFTLPNRLVRSATAEELADPQGYPKPELIQLYKNLARGGVGLIITGHMYVHPSGKAHAGMTGINSNDMLQPLSMLTDAVHREGGRIVVQINHGGMQCEDGLVPDPIAPSAMQPPLAVIPTREILQEEIVLLIDAYAQAARRAKEAGFDGVQLHGAHGYLISEFLSPLTNRRVDEWGGSLVNRMRFLRSVCQAVRAQVGPDYPLFIKLGMVDGPEGGLSASEGAQVVAELAGMELDGVEISNGFDGGKYISIRKAILKSEQEGYFRPLAHLARQKTTLPILLVGGFRSMEVMEATLSSGEADFISICRPLISEPDLPLRMRLGLQARSTCISAGRCFPKGDGKGISCKCNRKVLLQASV